MPRPKGYELKWHPEDKKWKLRLSGNERASFVFDKKTDGIKKGKELANDKSTFLRVYTRDGRHQETQNYSAVDRAKERS